MSDSNLTFAQIARTLGVSPAALTNWKNRYSDDFPPPAGVDSKGRRTYNLADIKAFLAKYNLGAVNRSDEIENGADPILMSLDICRNDLPIVPLLFQIVSAFALLAIQKERAILEDFRDGEVDQALKKISDPDIHSSLNLFLGRSPIEQIPLRETNGRANLNTIKKLANLWLLTAEPTSGEEFAARIYGHFDRLSKQQKSGDFSTTPSVVELITRIGLGHRILDICSGVGSIVHAYGRKAPDIHSQEIHAEIATLQRLLHKISGFNIAVHSENSIMIFHPEWVEKPFDVVIGLTPFGQSVTPDDFSRNDPRWQVTRPPRSKTKEAFFIESAIAYLTKGDESFVPRAILGLRPSWFNTAADAEVRSYLAESGLIEAVIHLGPGVNPSSPLGLGLLILRHQPVGNRTTSIRIIDATKVGKVSAGRRNLSLDDVDNILKVFHSKNQLESNASGENEHSIKVIDVSQQEVLAHDSVLEVQRYAVVEDPKASIERAFEAIDRVDESFHQLLKSDSNGVLVDSLKVIFSRIQNLDGSQVRLIRVMNRGDDGNGLHSRVITRPQGIEWNPDLVRPTDVVICLSGSNVATACEGRELIEKKLPWKKILLLRPVDDRIRPLYLLAQAQGGAFNAELQRFVTGTTIQSINSEALRNVQIAIPSTEIQSMVEMFVKVLESRTQTLETALADNEVLHEALGLFLQAYLKSSDPNNS
jgi:hypothetical protein